MLWRPPHERDGSARQKPQSRSDSGKATSQATDGEYVRPYGELLVQKRHHDANTSEGKSHADKRGENPSDGVPSQGLEPIEHPAGKPATNVVAQPEDRDCTQNLESPPTIATAPYDDVGYRPDRSNQKSEERQHAGGGQSDDEPDTLAVQAANPEEEHPLCDAGPRKALEKTKPFLRIFW